MFAARIRDRPWDSVWSNVKRPGYVHRLRCHLLNKDVDFPLMSLDCRVLVRAMYPSVFVVFLGFPLLIRTRAL